MKSIKYDVLINPTAFLNDNNDENLIKNVSVLLNDNVFLCVQIIAF